MVKNINLLPYHYKEKQKNKRFVFNLLIIQTVAILLYISLVYFSYYLANRTYTKLNYLNYQTSAYNLTNATYIATQLEILNQSSIYQNATISAIMYNIGNEAYINVVINSIPNSYIRKQRITYQNNRIEIDVMAYNINYIPIFTDSLQYLNYFRGIYIISTAIYPSGMRFTIEMFLR